jgi:fructose-bisphosphate aldolase, class I
MMHHELERISQTLVAEGKGILAADETVPTLTRRFDTLGIQSTEQSRRTYRDAFYRTERGGDYQRRYPARRDHTSEELRWDAAR